MNMFIATDCNANLIKEQFEDVEMGHRHCAICAAVKLGPGPGLFKGVVKN